MGTSRASGGAPSKVPMVPSWVPDVAPPESPDPGDAAPPSPSPTSPPVPPPVPIAPAARFRSTRTTLGKFAREHVVTDAAGRLPAVVVEKGVVRVILVGYTGGSRRRSVAALVGSITPFGG